MNTSGFTATLSYAGQDVEFAYATVNVPEQPQPGVIVINKSNAAPELGDYIIAGAVFEVLDS